MLFYNFVVVVGEELVCALTQLEPCLGLLRTWAIGYWAVPTQLPLCGQPLWLRHLAPGFLWWVGL